MGRLIDEDLVIDALQRVRELRAYDEIEEIKKLLSAQPTLYGYDIEHLMLIAIVLKKENLPPEKVVEALTDIERIVSIVRAEFEESLREAAINTFDNAKFDVGYCTEYGEGYNDGIDFAMSELPTLLSAQSEIIRCKDCKHRPKIAEGHDANDYTNNGFALDFPNDFACPCRCEDPYYSWMPADNWFCANGAKKEDER